MASLRRPDEIVGSKADVQRPLIHHLTADNSWLIQIPRATGRPFFNVLLDAWFVGNQIEFFQWFHEQGHTQDSAVKTMQEVESFVEEIEALARKYRNLPNSNAEKPASYIDAVAVSLRGTDHAHYETLTQLPPTVPIFSHHEGALKLVRSWNYFDTVVKTPIFSGNWTLTSVSPLPKDIGISGMQSSSDWSDLHAAILITFKTPACEKEHDNEPECVVYAPHGISPADATALATASPPVKVLAQLHGCLRVNVGFRYANFDANLGGRNGLALSQSLHSQYWLSTHDERKVEKGLTSWILTHDFQSVEDAAAEYAKRTGQSQAEVIAKANYRGDIGNGGSLILV
jgi:hypothetical protein